MLTITRFVCAGEYWCRQNHSFTLAETRLSYELSSNPPRVTLASSGQDTKVAVIPDAWLLFERSDGKKFPVILELDRATEYQERFKSHVRSRLELIISGVYKDYFGLEAVLIAYATTGSTPASRQTRLNTMQRWTQEVLAKESLETWASVFRFTSIEFERLYDHTHRLFTEASWFRPDSPTPVALLTTNEKDTQ